MHRTFSIPLRTRRRLAWLVAILLLWQQVAVAAYACTLVPGADRAVATALSPSAMAAMGGECADPQMPVDPLCRQHCQPNHLTQVEHHAPSVPFNALAAVPPVLASFAVEALPAERAFARLDQRRIRPPIPRLVYCTLLI